LHIASPVGQTETGILVVGGAEGVGAGEEAGVAGQGARGAAEDVLATVEGLVHPGQGLGGRRRRQGEQQKRDQQSGV
jgi:hypothetical protein